MRRALQGAVGSAAGVPPGTTASQLQESSFLVGPCSVVSVWRLGGWPCFLLSTLAISTGRTNGNSCRRRRSLVTCVLSQRTAKGTAAMAHSSPTRTHPSPGAHLLVRPSLADFLSHSQRLARHTTLRVRPQPQATPPAGRELEAGAARGRRRGAASVIMIVPSDLDAPVRVMRQTDCQRQSSQSSESSSES
eukprot:1653193-Rhodomonas_salina.1